MIQIECQLHYVFTKRLNDFLCGIQDAIAKGKVDERVDRTRRTLREMETKQTTGKQ